MAAATPKHRKLDPERVEEVAERLRALKAGLPETAVQSLAREVIQRVAARASVINERSELADADDDITRLAFALIDGDRRAGQVFVDALRDDGVSVDEAMLRYLAGAARRLGEWWDSDEISFMDVTLGTARIYGVLRAMDSDPPIQPKSDGRSAMFMSVPGEQHTLGVRMAADVFRRRGWDIELLIGQTHDELIEAAEATSTIIIGVSAGGSHALVALARLVLALRIHRPDATITISGRIVEEAPESLEHLSPDGMAPDLEGALDLIDRLWEQRMGAA